MSTPVINSVANSNGIVALTAGRYLFTLQLGCTYDNATSQPVTMALHGSISGNSPLLNVVTTRANAFGVQAFTNASVILNITEGQNYTMRLTNTDYLSSIDRNTKIIVQRVY